MVFNIIPKYNVVNMYEHGVTHGDAWYDGATKLNPELLCQIFEQRE